MPSPAFIIVGRIRKAHGIRGEVVVEPVVHTLGVQVERIVTGPRLILADDLDELAVARALGVGDDDAVHGGLFTAHAAETDLDGHLSYS